MAREAVLVIQAQGVDLAAHDRSKMASPCRKLAVVWHADAGHPQTYTSSTHLSIRSSWYHTFAVAAGLRSTSGHSKASPIDNGHAHRAIPSGRIRAVHGTVVPPPLHSWSFYPAWSLRPPLVGNRHWTKDSGKLFHAIAIQCPVYNNMRTV